jgi:hypothetical protein
MQHTAFISKPAIMRCQATFGSILLIMGLAFSPASPQNAEDKKEAPLVSDRPSESTSAGVLSRLTFQIEAGYTFKRRDAAGKRKDTHELPDTLFRFGVTHRLEARVQVTGWSFSDILSTKGYDFEGGFNDVSVGATLFLMEGQGWRPALGVLGEVSLPAGDPGFTDGYTHPRLLVLMDFVPAHRIGLTVNAGPDILRLRDEKKGDETVTDLRYVATVELSASERISLFGELYGALALNENRKNRLSYQGGVTFLLARLFQVDARAGAGLAGNVPNWLVGAGLSVRIPH